jgi:hypothetical protein
MCLIKRHRVWELTNIREPAITLGKPSLTSNCLPLGGGSAAEKALREKSRRISIVSGSGGLAPLLMK